MTKEKEKILERKLHKKLLALVDQISTIRREKGLSQKELGEGIEMDKGQMSRFMSAEKNVTLETVVRVEDFLGHEILVTPDDRDEALVDNPKRLWEIFEVALTMNSGQYLVQKVAANNTLRTNALLWNFSFPNGQSIFYDSQQGTLQSPSKKIGREVVSSTVFQAPN